MLTLLRNIDCYCPKHSGKKDILIADSKIYRMRPAGEIKASELIEKEIECDGLLAFPGLIDQHVHITGGGGEQSFQSRTPEIDINQILLAGVTTVVGLLGADGCTRSLENLYAKAKALEAQGITTFIYSGSYSLPAVTFTESITRDLVLIDKVVGMGEIAVSDHRSSQPQLFTLLKAASDTHLGGLLSGKAGVMHIHIGDGKGGLSPVTEMLENSDLPAEMFVPTHTNRNPSLFERAARFLHGGGHIDMTAGETAGIAVPAAVRRLCDEQSDMSLVTVSSDAGGSIPGGGVSKISVLYDDFRNMITQEKIPPETAVSLFTENVARLLKLFPKKGVLSEGSDADILITDKNYNLIKLICMGKLKVDSGTVL
jgi:beta-aspartyl-dipeptidase (metallo-type)